MGRAGPPPAPLPDPSSPDPLLHPSLISSSIHPSLSSDLTSSTVLAPDLAAARSSAGQSISGHEVLRQSPCQRASAPLAAAGSSSGISAQPAIRASDLAAAGSSSGLLSSAQALPLQPSRQPASSSPSSSCPAADRAAAGSYSAAVRDHSISDLSHPQIASVLPLLASVLQPPATSFAVPSSSSLPPPSQTATLQPPLSGSSMVCSKGSLDTPHVSATAQNPAPIGSTPGVRFNASTKHSSANHHNHIPPPSSVHSPSSSNPNLPFEIGSMQTQPPPHIAEHLPSSLPPPPHPPTSLSYVQAARQSRGSGFVRTHAADVESFARLPRTGANIICGSKEGMPSFSFVNSDLQTVENLYSNALIMKFHGGRPSLEVSHREIQSWGLEHPFSIGPLSSRAFLLRFQDNQDLIRVLTRPSSILITFSYKVFRWHNLCHLKDDSCYAPVWVSLPRLPLQCFIPEFLESVANSIGRFLCFDKATTTLARPSAARLCVELDLRITPPPFIWVGLFDGLKQPIIYEKLPKYCGECHIQGHLATSCPKGQRETPNIQASPRSSLNRPRPPPARQNAVKQISALLHQPNTLTAPPSNSHPPPPPNFLPTLAPTPSPLLNADAAQQHPLPAAYTTFPSPSLLLDADAAQLTPSHQPTYLQVLPSVSLLQRAPDAATPSNDHLQAHPTAALLQHPPAAAGPSDALLQTHPTAALLQQHSAAAGPSDAQPQPSPALLQRVSAAAVPSAGSEPLLQSASPVQRVSVSAATSSSSPAPSATSAHASDLMVPSMTHPPPKPLSSTSSKSLKGKHKSIKTKPPDVGISTSLTQQQQAALEQFKSKVLGHSQIRDHQLSSPTSMNHFEVLRYDHSDADDDLASYYSDTDDGCVEPTEMGYQSANGRSSNKHKDFAPSGMRINKRHPNMPLRVKLRSRKNSPSTP